MKPLSSAAVSLATLVALGFAAGAASAQPDRIIRTAQTHAQLSQSVNDLSAAGYRMIYIKGYATPSGTQARYDSVWEPDDGTPWTARFDMTYSQARLRAIDLAARGYRLVCGVPYRVNGQWRYADLWELRE